MPIAVSLLANGNPAGAVHLGALQTAVENDTVSLGALNFDPVPAIAPAKFDRNRIYGYATFFTTFYRNERTSLLLDTAEAHVRTDLPVRVVTLDGRVSAGTASVSALDGVGGPVLGTVALTGAVQSAPINTDIADEQNAVLEFSGLNGVADSHNFNLFVRLVLAVAWAADGSC